jgi:hypothetical protein
MLLICRPWRNIGSSSPLSIQVSLYRNWKRNWKSILVWFMHLKCSPYYSISCVIYCAILAHILQFLICSLMCFDIDLLLLNFLFMTVFLWSFDYFYWHCCGVGGYCCYCILISGVEKLVAVGVNSLWSWLTYVVAVMVC